MTSKAALIFQENRRALYSKYKIPIDSFLNLIRKRIEEAANHLENSIEFHNVTSDTFKDPTLSREEFIGIIEHIVIPKLGEEGYGVNRDYKEKEGWLQTNRHYTLIVSFNTDTIPL